MTRSTWVVLLALAVWRITHLLAAEDGPWNAVVRLRRAAGAGMWGELIDCFHCLSLWIAAPAAWWAGESWPQRLALWPALSGAAILLERATAVSSTRAGAPAAGEGAPAGLEEGPVLEEPGPRPAPGERGRPPARETTVRPADGKAPVPARQTIVRPADGKAPVAARETIVRPAGIPASARETLPVTGPEAAPPARWEEDVPEAPPSVADEERADRDADRDDDDERHEPPRPTPGRDRGETWPWAAVEEDGRESGTRS